MTDKYTYDDIRNYLDGRLDKTANQYFEQYMQQHPEFREEVNFYKNLQQATVRVNKEKDFSELVQQVDQNLAQEHFFEKKSTEVSTKPARSRRIFLPLAIAASFLVLFWFGGQYWASQNYSNEALVASYFQPFEASSADRGTEETFSTQVDAGLQAFQQNDYVTAIEQFQAVPDSSTLYAQSRYYLGQSYMANGNFEEAIVAFEAAAATDDVRFQERADWHAIQAMLLADSSTERLQRSLEAIINNPDHAYAGQAADLQKQLNSFWRKL